MDPTTTEYREYMDIHRLSVDPVSPGKVFPEYIVSVDIHGLPVDPLTPGKYSQNTLYLWTSTDCPWTLCLLDTVHGKVFPEYIVFVDIRVFSVDPLPPGHYGK